MSAAEDVMDWQEEYNAHIRSQAIPNGWKLVPIEPTPKMVEAAKHAIGQHIESLPEDDRSKAKNRPHGYRVKAKVKTRLRWQAMLAAAPAPPLSPG